jgi:hypothetical protein
VAWQRFGDVEYRVVQELEPPGQRGPVPIRRRALGAAVAVMVAGGLAAGAWGLTSSSSNRTGSRHPPGALRPWHNAPHMHYGAAGIPPTGNG